MGGPDRQGGIELRVGVGHDPRGDFRTGHRDCDRSVEDHGDQEADDRNDGDPRLRAHRGRFRRAGLPGPDEAIECGQAGPAVQKASDKEDDAKSILANGGFERGDTQGRAPADWRKGAAIPGVQYLWDRTKAHQGRASLHLKKTAQRYFPIAQWFQEVKREGDTPRLKVVAFVKAQKMTKAILDVQFVDHDGQGTHKWVAYIGAKEAGDPPVTHDWKKYEGVVAIPEGTEKLIIAAQIYGPGEVWFDDVAAEYTQAEATDPLAFNPRVDSVGGRGRPED